MIRLADPAARIIIALDVEGRGPALELIRELPDARVFKVGLELFTAEGPDLLKEISALGKEVFLDLKLHDIPHTVGEAARIAVRHGVRMMTIHASGGAEMMARAAAQEIEIVRKETGPGFLIVTPGIRPAWAAAQDQKRIMTPAEAVGRGSDYLVVGRPVTQAPSPREAFRKIVEELSA